jgi:hypothetical protein
MLKRAKDVGRIGLWILRLAPFKFRVTHTRGVDNEFADALSRMFEGNCGEAPKTRCASLMQSLPLVYSSLEEHQKGDSWCQKVLEELAANPGGIINSDSLATYYALVPGGKRRRWVVPVSLRSMLFHYFHDTAIFVHLGGRKTFRKIAAKNASGDFKYVRKCDLCHWAKPAQTTAVVFHSNTPPSRPVGRIFMDFVGPLTRTKRWNIAILVDAFSKFVGFRAVRKITAQAVCESLGVRLFSIPAEP